MQAQDQAVHEWIDSGGLDAKTLEEAIRANLDILTRVIEITRHQPASI